MLCIMEDRGLFCNLFIVPSSGTSAPPPAQQLALHVASLYVFSNIATKHALDFVSSFKLLLSRYTSNFRVIGFQCYFSLIMDNYL